MPEGWRAVYRRFADTMPWKWDHASGAWLDLEGIRALLSAHGLHIVSEAERKVLEACAAIPTEEAEGARGSFACFPNHPISKLYVAMWTAELARREQP